MTKPSEESLVYTIEDVARLLGLKKNHAYEAASRGDFPTIKVGRLLRVPKAALHAMIDAGAEHK